MDLGFFGGICAFLQRVWRAAPLRWRRHVRCGTAVGPCSEQAKLTASDGATGDRLGTFAALVGDTALVTAPRDDDGGDDSGSVYVFVRSATSWAEQQKIVASDASGEAWFGSSVSVSGESALVGANGDDATGTTVGAAYVFARTAASWAEQQKLTASDAAPGDELGSAASLDGDTALLGASKEDDAGAAAGAAYVFVRAAASWSEQGKLTAADATFDQSFGASVSVLGDAAFVGAPGDNEGGAWSGAAYGFRRAATVWSQLPKVLPSDPTETIFFGMSVSLGSDTAFVGAPDSWDPGLNTGAAYVYWLAAGIGAPCNDTAECADDHCVDGVCCDLPCDGACQGCAIVGSEGTCTLVEAGAAGDPSCAPYLCDGMAAACPSDCLTNADCTEATVCDDSTPGRRRRWL